MSNQDLTQEDINIVRQLYIKTKPAIISSIERIVANASKELAEQKLGQIHTAIETIAYSENLNEQVIEEFNLFIENKIRDNYANELDKNNNIYPKK